MSQTTEVTLPDLETPTPLTADAEPDVKRTATDLEAADIGKALGLRVDHVRKAKERGLVKLQRLAQAAGYWDDTLDVGALLGADGDSE